MAQKLKVTNSKRGQGKARADIVIWKSPKDKDDKRSAFIVIECKTENVKIHLEDYYQGFNLHQDTLAYNDIEDFTCSTHYQTFLINERKIIPEYLFIVLRSAPFINVVAGIEANGIKNESGFDFIGNFEIPLPPVHEQKKILNAIHATLKEAEDNIKKGNVFRKGLLTDIQSEVSDYKNENKQSNTKTSALHTIPFSSIGRWGVGIHFKKSILDTERSSFKYKSYSIGDLQTESLFGLSIKASSMQKQNMIPILRMPNIMNVNINCSELKYLPYKSAITNRWKSHRV